MEITATKFRQNMYKLLDQLLKTGDPIVIKIKGKKVRLVPENKPKYKSGLDKFIKRDTIVGNPDELLEIDWSKEWNPDDNI